MFQKQKKMPEYLAIRVLGLVHIRLFPKLESVFLVEAGTHLIIDAFCSPYRIGERRGALKLLRSVSDGMLLMWDRGLHSFKMVNATIKQKSHFQGERTSPCKI